METKFFPYERFKPDFFLQEAGLTRAPLDWADQTLGSPLVGFQNRHGHALFLIQANGRDVCEQCGGEAGDFVIEEVDHTGQTHNMACVCRNCVPQNMGPQGD